MSQPIDMERLARLGAIARLKELEEEAAAIRKAFPGLKAAEATRAPGAPKPPAAAPRKRKKRAMSPEARKDAADRMKAWWAKKRGQ
jgi:hypothetical protein